jgi:hypothetical protein
MTIGYPDSTALAIVISGRSIDIHIKHGDAGSNGEKLLINFQGGQD